MVKRLSASTVRTIVESGVTLDGPSRPPADHIPLRRLSSYPHLIRSRAPSYQTAGCLLLDAFEAIIATANDINKSRLAFD
jgi:hypothetical protein